MTIKLVRDKIPALMAEQGHTVKSVHPATGAELEIWLVAKLVEEAQEVYRARDRHARLSELADVMEVIYSLLPVIDCDERDLARAIIEKREARGGFERGYVVSFDE